MKRMILMLAIVCLSSAGCEQALDVGDDDGSSHGGANGVLSVTNSGAFATEQIDASNASKTWHITEVTASNHANICSQYTSTCESSPPPSGNTQMLAVTLFAADKHKTGRYVIGDFDEEDTPSDSLVAMGQVMKFQGGALADRNRITAGHLDVESYDAQSLSGTYELTVDGQLFTGTFGADHCQSLQTNRDNC